MKNKLTVELAAHAMERISHVIERDKELMAALEKGILRIDYVCIENILTGHKLNLPIPPIDHPHKQ